MLSIVVICAPSAWTASTAQLLTGLPVHQDRAGAAVRRVTPDGGTGLPDDFPQIVHEQHPGLDVIFVIHAVDGDGNLCHSFSSAGGTGDVPGANLGPPGAPHQYRTVSQF